MTVDVPHSLNVAYCTYVKNGKGHNVNPKSLYEPARYLNNETEHTTHVIVVMSASSFQREVGEETNTTPVVPEPAVPRASPPAAPASLATTNLRPPPPPPPESSADATSPSIGKVADGSTGIGDVKTSWTQTPLGKITTFGYHTISIFRNWDWLSTFLYRPCVLTKTASRSSATT